MTLDLFCRNIFCQISRLSLGYRWSCFQSSVIKPETDRNSAMNQSELEANTCNRRQAREKACERGMIGFGFALLRSTKKKAY